ncbi:hypothetical protein CMUS01_15568 [Colletotrichum musicola]|uniref:Uncharacterized protein n=1 Tax=Colletotrichum musicola TaxID=2175873 RepID=A0A8H6IVB2_9PEZI|nr:hypothetical protein CMUS01_15568 [Colletotrichum musicola]
MKGAKPHAVTQAGLQRLSPVQETHLANWVIAQGYLGLAPSFNQVRIFAERVLAQGGDPRPLEKH